VNSRRAHHGHASQVLLGIRLCRVDLEHTSKVTRRVLEAALDGVNPAD
jgi:hypothetical protein